MPSALPLSPEETLRSKCPEAIRQWTREGISVLDGAWAEACRISIDALRARGEGFFTKRSVAILEFVPSIFLKRGRGRPEASPTGRLRQAPG
jgi:hypothetical protein